MSNRRRTTMTGTGNAKPTLPPIINEDDGEFPFMKQDFFSDVALIVSTPTEWALTNQDPSSHSSRRQTQPAVNLENVDLKKIYM